MAKQTPNEPKVVVTKSGPYVVSGSVPLPCRNRSQRRDLRALPIPSLKNQPFCDASTHDHVDDGLLENLTRARPSSSNPRRSDHR
jgi:hypothetical protein